MNDPDGFDMMSLAKRRNAAKGEDVPQRSAVVLKLLKYLPGLRGTGDFSDEELRVAGVLLIAGAQQLDEDGKADADLWDDLDMEEAAEAELLKRRRVKEG